MSNNRTQNNFASLDHIIPLAVGGAHLMKNVRMICLGCNMGRPHDGSDIKS